MSKMPHLMVALTRICRALCGFHQAISDVLCGYQNHLLAVGYSKTEDHC